MLNLDGFYNSTLRLKLDDLKYTICSQIREWNLIVRHARLPLPVRYEQFLDYKELTKFTVDLEIAYESTQHEKILPVLEKLKEIKNSFEAKEAIARQRELEEAYNMLHELPYSVVTWLLHYREEELT